MGQARLQRIHRFSGRVEFVGLRDRADLRDRAASGNLSVLRAGAERGMAGWQQVVHFGSKLPGDPGR